MRGSFDLVERGSHDEDLLWCSMKVAGCCSGERKLKRRGGHNNKRCVIVVDVIGEVLAVKQLMLPGLGQSEEATSLPSREPRRDTTIGSPVGRRKQLWCLPFLLSRTIGE